MNDETKPEEAIIPWPTYTQVPNVIMERIHELSDPEFRVMMVIARQTLGFHQGSARMPLSYFEHSTGLCKNAVLDGTEALIKRGWITKDTSTGTAIITLRFAPKSGKPSSAPTEQGVFTRRTGGSAPTEQGGVHQENPSYKEREKKGDKEREDSRTPSAGDAVEGGNLPNSSTSSKPKLQGKGPPIPPPPHKSSPHAEFVRLWHEAYPLVFARKYAFQHGKDGAAVKRLVESTGMTPAELILQAKYAWGRMNQFNCKFAASISGFSSRYNEIMAEISVPVSGQSGHVAFARETPVVDTSKLKVFRGSDFVKGKTL